MLYLRQELMIQSIIKRGIQVPMREEHMLYGGRMSQRTLHSFQLSFLKQTTREVHKRLLSILSSIFVFCVLVLSLTACRSSGNQSNASTSGSGTVIHVVAGENFWGSIASQIGGTHASVTSLVKSPTGDPHDYESTTADARSMAQAGYVILNGAGYDDWGQKLIDANPVDGRKVLNVANLVGKRAGDNPHLWYNPDFVEKAANQITADYKTLDSADARYFDQQRTIFEQSLQPYHDMISSIKTTYAGAKIGISESIFIYMADALGLNVITPPAYYTAEAEGNDPPTASVVAFNSQITKKQIQVFVLNVQTIDNTVKNIQALVAEQKLPVIEISETVRPADGKFQDWQVAQLTALQQALAMRGTTN